MKDNGTEWKWWPMHKSYDAEVVTCNDDWAICSSRQPASNETSSNDTVTTPAPVPNKCIACGKATWKRIGVGEEEGEIFVSMGCYGSLAGAAVEEMSCTHDPRGDERGSGPVVGGDIRSVCFCNEDKCNEGSTFSVKKGLINIVYILGSMYGLLLLIF